jgi:hypothetical protein
MPCEIRVAAHSTTAGSCHRAAWATRLQDQSNPFKAHPEFQILVMCRILFPSWRNRG